MTDQQDYITLKWGTLKSWRITSERGRELLQRYNEIGSCVSAMMQNDTPEQKQIICDLIDTLESPTVHLDWDGVDVPKEEAKKYVMEYRA